MPTESIQLKPEEIDVLREMFDGDPLLVTFPRNMQAHLTEEDDLLKGHEQPWPTSLPWPTVLRFIECKLLHSVRTLNTNIRIVYRISSAGRCIVLFNDFDSQGNRIQE